MESFLNQSAGYLTHIVGLLLKREFTETIKKNDINITPEQWAVLNRLKENSGITQKELAKASFKDATNITRIIDKLENKGLIHRKANPSDRRIWEVYITDQGIEVRDLIEPLAKAVLLRATKSIDDSEMEMYNSIAKKIIDNLVR